MTTLIKLLIAAAALNAAVRGGLVALDYYRFEDAAQQAVLFGGDATVPELHEQILRRAADHSVSLEPEDLTVRREGTRTVADVTYTEEVEVFPGYRYPLTLSFSVDASRLIGGAARTTSPP